MSFIVLLGLVVIVTLATVQSATYNHSTGQALNQTATSISVVSDQLQSRGRLLKRELETYFREYNTIKLISGGKSDPKSLISVLNNHQSRADADITWVLDKQGELIASTRPLGPAETAVRPEDYQQEDKIQFMQLDQGYYLIKSAPVRYIPKSPVVSAWVVMAVDINKLVNQHLVDLTDMQVSLLRYQTTPQLIATTFDVPLDPLMQPGSLTKTEGLHDFALDNTDFLYSLSSLGELHSAGQNEPLYLMLATEQSKAYLSYNSLLVQLFVLIGAVALIAFGIAAALSRTITRPVSALVDVAHRISRGDYVEGLPGSSIDEVCSLTDAVSDMQNNIRKREAQVHQLAYFDELTGLPNRVQFADELKTRIDQETPGQVCVLMLDLDRFTDINDTLGHELGDKLIIAVAKRLSKAGYEEAFIARLGGDEFGVIIEDPQGSSVDEVAKAFAALFETPFNIESLVLSVDTSIGVSVFPTDSDNVSGLILCADIALYSCKGKHYRYALYKPELNRHSVQRLSLMHDLKRALAEDQLYLNYQPKLSIASGRVDTVECLIRWQHPEHGFVPPDEFIPLAEQTGAIRDITRWALRKALAQQQAWRNQGYSLGVAVNISAIDLIDLELPALVSDLLAEHQASADSLILEVTESAVMSDPENAVRALQYLCRMGIGLSVDDFGTGYSSMAQLKKMPVNELKIDKAFVLELATNEEDQIMVKTLISLAHNLGLQTVAEGVEDQASLTKLEEMGCTKAQGFYLSRPVDANALVQWMNDFHQAPGSDIEPVV